MAVLPSPTGGASPHSFTMQLMNRPGAHPLATAMLEGALGKRAAQAEAQGDLATALASTGINNSMELDRTRALAASIGIPGSAWDNAAAGRQFYAQDTDTMAQANERNANAFDKGMNAGVAPSINPSTGRATFGLAPEPQARLAYLMQSASGNGNTNINTYLNTDKTGQKIEGMRQDPETGNVYNVTDSTENSVQTKGGAPVVDPFASVYGNSTPQPTAPQVPAPQVTQQNVTPAQTEVDLPGQPVDPSRLESVREIMGLRGNAVAASMLPQQDGTIVATAKFSDGSVWSRTYTLDEGRNLVPQGPAQKVQ